jgi:16S rRNA A1518/A1519 N6-dimethyltransferase RsmA/KsgA/DIM1 with predicted DNA glycosylase/AP lyase activity
MILGIIIIVIVCGVITLLSVSFYITIFGGGPFVPTPFPAVHKVLKHAKIKKGDKVYDIGAGDGRFVHFAEKNYKANATGFELDPFVFFLAKIRQWIFRWKGKMIQGNFLNNDISDAKIVICYMLPKTLEKFQTKFDKELKQGTRVISYAFHIGSWKPKKIIKKEGRISQIFIYEISKNSSKKITTRNNIKKRNTTQIQKKKKQTQN